MRPGAEARPGAPRRTRGLLRSASPNTRARFAGLKNASRGSVPNLAPMNVSMSFWLALRSASRRRRSSSVGGWNEAARQVSS